MNFKFFFLFAVVFNCLFLLLLQGFEYKQDFVASSYKLSMKIRSKQYMFMTKLEEIYENFFETLIKTYRCFKF